MNNLLTINNMNETIQMGMVMKADEVVQLVGMLMEGKLDQVHGEELKSMLEACVRLVQCRSKKLLMVQGLGHGYCLPLDDIAWLEADRAYTVLHMTDGKVELLTTNLNYLMSLLHRVGRMHFVRINRSRAVNILYVRNIIGHTVYVMDRNFKVSRLYMEDFKQYILQVGRRS